MPIVAMPDNTQVQFPDDMPADQIRSLILQKFPDAGGSKQEPPPANQRGVMDRLLGTTGPRYQMWPERVARDLASSAVNAPHTSMQASENLRLRGNHDPNTYLENDYSPKGPMDAATLANPGLRFGRDIKTAADVRAAAQRGYKSPVVSDVRIDPAGTAKLADTLIAAAEQKGLRPAQQGAGEIYSAASELRGLPNATSVPKGNYSPQTILKGPGYHIADDVFTPAPATIQDLTGVRTALGSTIKSGTDAMTGQMNPVAGRAAQVRGGITEYLNNIPKDDVIAGNADAAGRILRTAGQDYSASKKLAIIDALQHRAELNAGAANSGTNINNATRQEVKNFLKNQQKSRGLTDEQVAAAETAVMGTHVGNSARSIANQLDPRGALSMTNMGAVGAAGGFLGHAAGFDPAKSAIAAILAGKATGKVARGVANASEERALEKFRQTVLKESPSARQSMLWDETQARRAAIVKALLFGGLAQ